ncbi:MAG: hypothetical protein NTW03_02255 [Verrucomicrobia bacterium]|nr:hypothetical protein [Verrucomicrobiota bacterium]
MLAIYDAIYRGREDFVYRVTIGELPFITSIFPLGGQMGVSVTPKIKGWNLQDAVVTPPTMDAGPAIKTLTAKRNRLVFNPCRMVSTRNPTTPKRTRRR